MYLNNATMAHFLADSLALNFFLALSFQHIKIYRFPDILVVGDLLITNLFIIEFFALILIQQFAFKACVRLRMYALHMTACVYACNHTRQCTATTKKSVHSTQSKEYTHNIQYLNKHVYIHICLILYIISDRSTNIWDLEQKKFKSVDMSEMDVLAKERTHSD